MLNNSELQEAILKQKNIPTYKLHTFSLLVDQLNMLDVISKATNINKSKLIRMGLNGVIELYKQSKL